MTQYFVSAWAGDRPICESVACDSLESAIRFVHDSLVTGRDEYKDVCFRARTNDGRVTQLVVGCGESNTLPRDWWECGWLVSRCGHQVDSILIQSAETALADLTESLSERNDCSAQAAALRAAGIVASGSED